jgi:anti-anti-sigma factor
MVHISTDTGSKPRAIGLFVQGQLDLTAVSAFRCGLTRAVRSGRSVEIHLREVDFIDGCGLGMLMDAIARAQRAGVELSIVDVSRCVRRLIAVTDTAERLPLFSSTGCRRAEIDDELTGTTVERAGAQTVGR